MATSFSSLPIIDLSLLSSPSPSPTSLASLSKELHDVFATTGFAYLVNAPLSFTHADVFDLARDFFRIDDATKMSLAKKTFVRGNRNTYRGYFPPQPGQQGNLKEGFEIGPARTSTGLAAGKDQKFDLTEPNVWPDETSFPNGRARLEELQGELQQLACTLLSLLALSLGQPATHFAPYLRDSLSTLRLLHYPPQPLAGRPADAAADAVALCCTPHTDSGLLTLLHQDPTGGLEVRDARGRWVPALYVPGSLVVNIGDLMARVSGGRFVATVHRVRATAAGSAAAGRADADGLGRLSVPFFFEPGEACVVRGVDGGEGVVYGEHVRRKMGTWVEFQDVSDDAKMDETVDGGIAVAAY